MAMSMSDAVDTKCATYLLTVVAYSDAGAVYVRDVAQVVVTYKELVDFVRSKGESATSSVYPAAS